MNVVIKFFGATAEVTGERQIEINSVETNVASELFDQILNNYPDLKTHDLLFSVNQQYSTGSETIHDGDELAIFTAVSGG